MRAVVEQKSDQNPSKIDVADILGQHMTSSRLSTAALKKLEDLAWWFIDAREEDVREIMARHLRHATDLADSTIERIVKDPSERVAGPFIEATQLLSEEQWLSLMEELEAHALTAVARRQDVSERMAMSILDSGEPGAVRTLVQNDHAPVTGRLCNEVIDRFGDDPQVVAALARRDDLPGRYAQQLSERLRQRNDDSRVEAHEEIAEAPQGAEKERRYDTVSESQLIDRLHESGPDTLAENIKQLAGGGRISDEFLLAAAQKRDLTIFAMAMGQRTYMPPNKIRNQVRTGDLRAFRELFQRGKVRKDLWAPIASALTSALS